MFPFHSIIEPHPSFLPCVRKRWIKLAKELRWRCVTVWALCWLQMQDSLFIRHRGLKGNALFVQVEELQVVLGELHELSEGARLHPRSMTAHILLKIHRLHHLCQGQLPIKIKKIWIKDHYLIKKAQQSGIVREETNTSLRIYWYVTLDSKCFLHVVHVHKCVLKNAVCLSLQSPKLTFASLLRVSLSQPIWFFQGISH